MAEVLDSLIQEQHATEQCHGPLWEAAKDHAYSSKDYQQDAGIGDFFFFFKDKANTVWNDFICYFSFGTDDLDMK